MPVQPAKPASPIRFLYEELPNVDVFSAHKMLDLCVLFIADTNTKKPCVSCSLEVGTTFLILSYSKGK